MRQHLIRRWFLIVLAAVVWAGFQLHDLLGPVVDQVPRGMIVAGVLFTMSFSLDAHVMWRALRRPYAVLLATACSFGLVPLLAWGTSAALLSAGLLERDLAVGLLIVGAVPSTLASAAVWTRRAGGNDAVALLVTMITNLACFIVTPLWLLWTSGTSAELKLIPMVQRLTVIVVLPMAVGQLMRLISSAGRWATRHRIALGVAAQAGVLSMILIGAVSCGQRLAVNGVRGPGFIDWSMMLTAVVGLHLASLVLAHALARSVGLPPADSIAVGFSGSQKTLMVGLDLALVHFTGLAMLPMVAYHVCQLLVDTAIADRLRRIPGKQNAVTTLRRE